MLPQKTLNSFRVSTHHYPRPVTVFDETVRNKVDLTTWNVVASKKCLRIVQVELVTHRRVPSRVQTVLRIDFFGWLWEQADGSRLRTPRVLQGVTPEFSVAFFCRRI